MTALASCPLPALPELSLAADAALWAGFADGTLRAYLGSSAELRYVIEAHNSSVVALTHFISSDSSKAARLVSSSKKGTLRVWGGDGSMWRERWQLAWLRARRARCMTSVEADIVVGTWNVNAKDHSLDGAEGLARWLSWQSAGGNAPPAGRWIRRGRAPGP